MNITSRIYFILIQYMNINVNQVSKSKFKVSYL